MDWERVGTRLQSHPVWSILMVIGSVLVPLSTFFSSLHPLVGYPLTVVIWIGLWWHIWWIGTAAEPERDGISNEPATTALQSTGFDEAHRHVTTVESQLAVDRHDQEVIQEVGDRIAARFYNYMGSQARYNYVRELCERESQYNPLYHDVIQDLTTDPKWKFHAHAVIQWVNIAFNELSENGHHVGAGARYALYAAACKHALSENDSSLPLQEKDAFARTVRRQVAERKAGL